MEASSTNQGAEGAQREKHGMCSQYIPEAKVVCVPGRDDLRKRRAYGFHAFGALAPMVFLRSIDLEL